MTKKLPLTGDLKIASADDLAQQLNTALTNGDVTLCTKKLVSIDAASLQVLLSAFKTAQGLAHRFAVDMPSGSVLETALDRIALLPLAVVENGVLVGINSVQTRQVAA
ncbi:STAS domain protein [Roseovarius mucosus DSM 17069]|uniref:STAS domain protein n=1 Tax=Roseovarius mucosus DSM 17069 TaxID=1288298 RepID=A0A0A0HKV2_9RHOB|nr:STAS domain-containing protein [Roseovarius mucosus]KGM88462.1 STAS domain protein [Roseovarius mucosus DSM 17069]MAN97894.1 STAS domain-containing protein [Roseovarius sp.]MBD12593.1 STAS domain-containing protein [Roseovarius sp.]|tara:strand:+ start:405 stop:728 length:324 start_codon:yes stop_codon:yes gene_type:complete